MLEGGNISRYGGEEGIVGKQGKNI